jgi:CheY-like chemotaxis protein
VSADAVTGASVAEEHRCAILVVEDDRETQDVLRVALTADGYLVSLAATGRDGIDHLRSHDETCVILLDLMLPDMDGSQFRAIQRRDRSLAWIPVIVMSGALDVDIRARTMMAQGVLNKPFDLDALRAAVARVSGLHCRHCCGPEELAPRKGRPLSSA